MKKIHIIIKNTIIVAIGSISVASVFFAFVGLVTYIVEPNILCGTWAGVWYKIFEGDEVRVEYPLAKVDVNDDSEYLLVKTLYSPDEKYEVVTDTRAIKANVSVFRVENMEEIYGTTAEGGIKLYKNGREIDHTPFDNMLPSKFEYGTLKFRQINELELYLFLRYVIMEQGDNYSIIYNNRADKPTYFCFAHGRNTESIDTVHYVHYGDSMSEMARPRKINDDMIEFVYPIETCARDETWHRIFRISDGKLSEAFLNVKAIHGSFVVSTKRSQTILIRDIFDRDVYYKEIFVSSRAYDRLFLLKAEFIPERKIRTEYVGADGRVRNEVFSMD
jgi:hypothetical protein